MTRVDLFAPAGERLPLLGPIQQIEGFEITTIAGSAASVAEGIQRRRYEVRVKARPGVLCSSPGGSYAKSMTFRSDAGSSALATVIWRLVDRYLVTPSPLHFGTIEADGSSKEMRVFISASADQPLAIESIASDSEYLVVERDSPTPATSLSTRQMLKFVLTVPQGVDRNALSGVVRIDMGDREATTVPVRWSAFIRRQVVASGDLLEVPDGTGKDGAR